MAFSSFFLDAAVPHSAFVHGTHHQGLVMLSMLVSIFSSTMGLQTAHIARHTKRALYYHVALITGALALGGGIWATHFIGMLAFELPVPVSYAVLPTVLSFLPACLASWMALGMLAQTRITWARLLTGGALVGLGIGTMHYSGMAAMRMPLDMRYEPLAFMLSIVVAIALAVLAVWVRYGLQRTSLARFPRLLLSGCVMGLAIASMHYTGMASVRFIGVASQHQSSILVSNTLASYILAAFTVAITVVVVAVNGLIRSRELYVRLREGSSRLRATLDTAVDGIITINSKGLIQDYNRSAERLFGWTAEEVMGRNIKMLMPEPYQSAHDGYLHNYMTTGKPKIIGTGREVVGLRRDGSHMPMRLAVGRVELPGELLFVGFVSDISDRHALEASLRETAARAEQAAEAKTTFLANMSHEIRTPVNSVIGFTELLQQTDLTQTQRSHLNTVRTAARSLLRLINDILDTTKMEKGELELEDSDFSLKALAMQIESSLSLSAHAKNLAFSIHYPEDMQEHFKGDALRILQILTNLVGNAIKFTESGSVEVVFAHDASWVHIQVRDTGIGMTPQQVEMIFAPFAQADASISRRFGGTGLGTTIAHQLVDQMGGSIEAESSPGQGSTFHVRLPLQLGSWPTERESAGMVQSLPPLHILIADDVPQNLELLALTLEREGHTTVSAQDGRQVVEKFKAGRFDVVLMDVHMPGLDGLEAARQIRQFERSAQREPTPVIALTASVMAEDRRAASQAGMDGFAVKPLDAPRLFEEIARVRGAGPLPAGQEGSAADGPDQAIDWGRGLALWGDKKRFLHAVDQFLVSVDEKYPLPLEGRPEVDGDTVLFSLHGLRGVASNLALSRVASLAGLLEQALRQGQPVELRKYEELWAALIQVRETWSMEAHNQPPPELPEPPTRSVSAQVELLPDLQQLLNMTLKNELDDSLLDRVRSGLEQVSEQERALALRNALDTFEFAEAARILEQLILELAADAVF